MARKFFGLVNLNKPLGVTSRRAVDYVQRRVAPAKAGHAGTLDPLAEGVLVVAVGPATRLIDRVQALPKQYRATFRLGCSSESDDTETPLEWLSDPLIPSQDQLEAAMAQLTGPILQRPPAYSAIKQRGRRAYDLARRGRQINLEPRTVEVYGLAIVAYAYPELTLDIQCGAGTYVRALGRDLASLVGTKAVMTDLVRMAVGQFQLADATTISDVENLEPSAWLLSPLVALAEVPRLVLSASQCADVLAGRAITAAAGALSGSAESPDVDEAAAVDESGTLVAILRRQEPHGWRPTRCFPLVD